jgi:hypothetical protein
MPEDRTLSMNSIVFAVAGQLFAELNGESVIHRPRELEPLISWISTE